MKIFISWSGPTSKKVAEALQRWLPYCIQSLKPFVSNEIEPGMRWSDNLASQLMNTDFGIICVTRYNMKKPWLNFEAGALSKVVDRACVIPFLFNLNISDVDGPLSQYQFTAYNQNVDNRDAIFELLCSINARFDISTRLEHEFLRNTFEMWWDSLDADLKKINEIKAQETEPGYPWLFTMRDLINTMSRIKHAAVWVVAVSPEQYLENDDIKSMLGQHIKAEVKYTVIVPSTPNLLKMLDDLFLSYPTKPQIIPVPPKELETLASTTYVLLDPESNSIRGFLELPIKESNYWVEVTHKAARSFVARFREKVETVEK